MDLLKTMPSRVWIGNEDNAGFWQELVVENLSRYCSHCFLQGHAEDACHALNPTLRATSGQRRNVEETSREAVPLLKVAAASTTRKAALLDMEAPDIPRRGVRQQLKLSAEVQ